MSRFGHTGRVAQVDLNADVGESFGRWTLGDDDAVLAVVTSANVACGFHAGDPLTLRRTCATAVEHGVSLGAQVSYRDLAGFGRRFMDVSPDDLAADVLYQVGALGAIAAVAGGNLGYVKPHGALNNAVMTHREQAEAVVAAVHDLDPGLRVLGMPGSELLAAAERVHLRTVTEAFGDRGYRADGSLVPRGEPGAMVTDPDEVAARVVRMVTEHRVTAVDGTDVEVVPDSVCLHGDTAGAVEMAVAVRTALTQAGITLRAFA